MGRAGAGARWLAAGFLGAALAAASVRAADPYEDYVRNSVDFRPVKQDKAWATKAFPGWLFMPWTYQWRIGYTPESARWSKEHGYNGAFIDRGEIEAGGSATGRLDWINENGFRFYMDHTGGKGLLHLWDGNQLKPHLDELHGTGVRPVPLNAATREKIRELMRKNIGVVKASPQRAAYALDDEPSWGHFVHPTMWRVSDDAADYAGWLKQVYGAESPNKDRWISYEELRKSLPGWSVGEFDASPLLNQWTYNDATWANFIGGLVEDANALDPATPCGFVGGQSPSAFGGYDYARLMRKVQFLESYNMGSSQAIIRSFNPGNALPAVTSLFHQSVDDTVWQTWYYLAHGNRGHIGWVEGWFDGKTPAAWHDAVATAFIEAGKKIGPLMSGTEWVHDGVAIYYSHPSIQLGWILDAQAHGKTWVNRNNDERLASAVHVRHAWENMLRDSGIQYNYISYVDVIQKGISSQYKVLILPATLCLSDAEARRIKAFTDAGGTVIADYLPGVWDQHGRGRREGGALDGLFGVKHEAALRPADLFNGGALWVEVDQDANYSWKTYTEFLTKGNTCLRDASGFNKAVRAMPVDHTQPAGKGRAVLMNLSPQWYNAHRVEGSGPAAKRGVFMRHLTESGIKPRVRIVGQDEAVHGYEITYWRKPAGGADGSGATGGGKDRLLYFVGYNPEITGDSLGGGNSKGLKTATLQIELEFSSPMENVRNERTGEVLGRGQKFKASWKQNECVVLSCDAPG